MICSAVSCIASFSLLCFLSYQTIRARFSRERRRRSGMRDNTPQGYFWLVQLFLAGTIPPVSFKAKTKPDFIQSFASLLAIRYMTTNQLITGPYCTFQAVGLISGDIGSAIWTFVITLNTFLLLAGGRNTRAWVIEKSTSGWGRWVVCFFIWVFILFSGLFGLIFIEPFGSAKGPYCTIPALASPDLEPRLTKLDDQSGAGWCYIGSNHFWERIFFTYGIIRFAFLSLSHVCSIPVP